MQFHIHDVLNMEQLTDVIYILTLSDSDKYIAMGKKGKKASNSGKKKKQSQDTSLPVLENNDANGIIDQQVADELAFIRKDKRFCNDLINHKLLLPNKPDMNINPLVMRQQLLSTNEQTTTSKRLIRYNRTEVITTKTRKLLILVPLKMMNHIFENAYFGLKHLHHQIFMY